MEQKEFEKKRGGRRAAKFFLWFFIVIVLIAGAAYAWFHFSETGNRDPFSVIPDDAVYIIETTDLTKGWIRLNDSKVWQHLNNNEKFAEINASATSLDSLIRGNKTLDMLFSDRKLLISAHMISLTDYDFIFAVDLKKAAKITFLKDYISGIVAGFGYSLSKRDYKGEEVMLLTDKKSGEVLSLCFIENVMVCSYVPALVEKSIRQKDLHYWAENRRFNLVADEISSGKLFNFYLNYALLHNFLRCYLSESSDAMKSLSRALAFSAFNVAIEDEHLTFTGFTGVVDSVPSYISALMGVSPGKMMAHTIVSDKAAVYLSIAFDDFNVFFENLKKQFNAEDTTRAQNYDKTIKKFEKYFKINITNDFFGWIGKEIAFIKMEPTANAREEDVVVTIHAKDIAAAERGLDRITSQVRKKTIGLARFKEGEYKGYTIKYLGFSGFFRIFFGKLFNKIERPYFTYIDDFVVFSNSPSCLIDIIDDYLAGTTLAGNETFMDFAGRFNKEANVSVFVQMPKVYSHLYYYSKGEKRKGIADNKDIILGFTRVGFQMVSRKNLFHTTLISLFDEDAAFHTELEKIDAAAEELYVHEIDTGFFRISPDVIAGEGSGPVRILHDDSIRVKYEGRLTDGRPEGLWRIYYNSGKMAGIVHFVDGNMQGDAIYYHDSERQTIMAQLSYEKDQINGNYHEFYQSGQRKASVSFSEGLMDGNAVFFYESGMMKMEGPYKNGFKIGKWKYYTELGEVIDKEKWRKGLKKRKK